MLDCHMATRHQSQHLRVSWRFARPATYRYEEGSTSGAFALVDELRRVIGPSRDPGPGARCADARGAGGVDRAGAGDAI